MNTLRVQRLAAGLAAVAIVTTATAFAAGPALAQSHGHDAGAPTTDEPERRPQAHPGTEFPTGAIDMSQPHVKSGQVVSVLPLGDELSGARTTALLKAEQLEVVRIVLHAGQGLREHKAPGEITVQCLEGDVEFQTPDTLHRLRAGDFIHLRGGEPHSLQARADSSLLVTICLVAPR